MSVKVGVIGAGIYGLNMLKAFRQFGYDGECQLVALADVDEQRLNERASEFGIQGYADYREMLQREPLDAVAIATPDHLHRQIAVDAAGAGKHLFVQKPLDITVEGCEAMIGAAKSAGVLMEIDFHKRFDPPNRALARAVREGRLGKVQYGYAWVEDTIEVPSEWLVRWAADSTPCWFIGIHALDVIRWVLGSEVKRVYASGMKGKLASLGIDTYDSIQAKVEFENSASVTFDMSWILPKRFESIINQGFRLVGTEGIWEIDGQNRGVEICTTENDGMKAVNFYFLREEVNARGEAIVSGYGLESVKAFVDHVKHLAGGGKLEDLQGWYASGYDGMQATRIAVAIHDSVARGEIVQL